jgi:hypothetical protein
MTSFTIDYDTYKVTSSLNTETIFISIMNNNTYTIYEKEISIVDFNNDKFTLTNLYNIFQRGFKKDSTIDIGIELHNKILKINFIIISDIINFEHSFELHEKNDDNIHMKELKKELNELKQKNNKLESQIKNIINKNTKLKSIIPIINIEIDEDEVETKYKWFLDWFFTLVDKNPKIDKFYTNNQLPNNTIDGKTPSNNLGWNIITLVQNNYNGPPVTEFSPDKNLYYYLKQRNIKICKDTSHNMYWTYTM